MNEIEIINDYVNGNKEYTKDELKHFILGYAKKKVSDEIMTKFLKSIFNKDLSIEKTAEMTEIMMYSGDVINLEEIPGIKVDKHSTGGVGDKVTLIVAPIVAALGVPVAKMSGRGLGFTGGTLDKLESIRGYDIFLSEDEFKQNIIKHNIAVIGQTKELVPADKRIYALRDETNLIASMPLIASSIMSKKLATGADAILLDVKCGDAAFMKNQTDAEKLASWMINLGKAMGKNVRAEITSMETPLGKMIGNKNEVLESLWFLQNKDVSNDLKEVIYSSSSTMLVQAGKYDSEEEAKIKIKEVIESGKALEKFKEWIISQKGDFDSIIKEDFWNPKHSFKIISENDGYMNITGAVKFGELGMKLGAGRAKKEDSIDYEAGIEILKKTGDEVKKGEIIFVLYSSNEINPKIINELSESFEISSKKIDKKTILNKL